ncbi:hypothetical protein B0A49_07886, partial [Cryomyces minteri]
MPSVVAQLGLLSLVSSALAVPWGGHSQQDYSHHYHVYGSGSSSAAASRTGAPFDLRNSTGVDGVAASTGFPSAGFAASTERVTSTQRVFVTVSSAASSSSDVASTSHAVAPADATSLTISLNQKRRTRTTTTSTTSTSSSTTTTNSGSSSVAAVAAATTTRATTTTSTTSTTTTSSSTTTTISKSSSVAAVAAATTTRAATTTSTTSAKASTSSSASSVAVAATTASASTLSGKRGLAYNDGSLTNYFTGSSLVTWGHNWANAPSGLASSFEFVPLLWGTASGFTSGWSAAATSAISKGATHLMSFNEPDLSTQANLSPEAAAAGYKTYMMPFQGKAKLGAPAVTNGGGAMGLTWMKNFMTACSGCQIDFVAIHWYDSATNIAYFKNHVTNATAMAGGRPVWITEFGASGTDAEVNTFLQTVLPWLDQQPSIERYAYFM